MSGFTTLIGDFRKKKEKKEKKREVNIPPCVQIRNHEQLLDTLGDSGVAQRVLSLC